MDADVLKGVIHGKTIELETDPGLLDGQEVAIRVLPAARPDPPLPAGEGLRRSFGAWAKDAEELDEYLEWSRAQRKLGRPVPES
jgi:hypothetical protein